MDHQFTHSSRHVAMWDRLTECLLGQGIKRDNKYRENWDKLMADYKDVTNSKHDQCESSYYTEFTIILGCLVEAT